MIGVMSTASFSKMLHSIPFKLGRTSSPRLCAVILPVHKNGLAAPDGPLHRAAEARSNVRTQTMALHEVFGMEIERSGNIHYRKIRVRSGNQTTFVGDPEPARRLAREEGADSFERQPARMMTAIQQDRQRRLDAGDASPCLVKIARFHFRRRRRVIRGHDVNGAVQLLGPQCILVEFLTQRRARIWRPLPGARRLLR